MNLSEGGFVDKQLRSMSMKRCRKRLDNLCQSDSLSEEGIRDVILRHGLKPNSRYADNNYEFFYDACQNERVNKGIIRCLLEYFPDAARTAVDEEDGWSPLHFACYNKSMTRGMIRLLIYAAPDSVRSVTNAGSMPLHCLCANIRMKDTGNAIAILKLLIQKHPEAVRHADNDGCLPIHVASWTKSPEFCGVLIEAHPGSERISDAHGKLPFHNACFYNTVATVEYLYNLLIEAYPRPERIADAHGRLPLHRACECNTVAMVDFLYNLYPDAINHAETNGLYPIHCAINRLRGRYNPVAAVEIVQYLLDSDPNVKLQMLGSASLLQYACRCSSTDWHDSNITALLNVVKTVYDAHPEAIENILNTRYHDRVQAFFNREGVYVRQAKDLRLMNKPNGKALHRALHKKAALGSIKLLVKANPLALHFSNNSGALPLHIACRHNAINVIQYLVGLDTTTLNAVDKKGNTALHDACSRAKYQTISMLLDNFDAVSVSKRNAQKKLPIDLLWESRAVSNREFVKYFESVFRLLKAYPETLANVCPLVQSASNVGPSQITARKCGNE